MVIVFELIASLSLAMQSLAQASPECNLTLTLQLCLYLWWIALNHYQVTGSSL